MSDVQALIAKRKRQDWIFQVVGLLCTLIGLATLAALLIKLAVSGAPVLSRATFFYRNASYMPDKAGILFALVGSLCTMLVTFCAAVPLGIAAAIYLEEYARKNWLTSLIE